MKFEPIYTRLKHRPRVIWPDIFFMDELPEEKGIPQREHRLHLCAEALIAWGNCSFEKPPKNFGKIMAQIGQELGITATRENLMKYSQENR